MRTSPIHRHVLSAFLLAAFVAAILPMAAQETVPSSEGAPTTLTVTSRLVVLDVVVADKKGGLHNDLTKDSFQITEDGMPQTILDFEPPSEHVLPPGLPIESTAELQRRAPQAPVNVIVLDELNTRFEDMAYARYALRRYLNAQPGKLQAPTTLLAVNFQRLLVLKDYTQDKAAVLLALKQHLAAYPWHLQTGTSRVVQLAQSLGALEQVSQAIAGHPGHKNVLWIGHGFPGIDLTNPNLDSNVKQGISSAVQQAVNILRDSRMTLYSIDPTALSSTVSTTQSDDTGPLGSLTDPASDPFAGDVNITALAKATGGRSFFSRNDVDAEIGESARDGLSFYTITYRPTGTSSEQAPYRKIRVTFTQPGLIAGFRDGYYARNDAAIHPAVKRATYDIDSAIENTMVYTGLSVSAVEKPDAPGTYYVGVPQSQLTWTNKGSDDFSKLTLVAVAISNKGRLLRRVTDELTARRPANDAGGPQSVRLQIAVPEAPGTVRIRFVVRGEPDGRVGTADLRLPGAPPDAKPAR